MSDYWVIFLLGPQIQTTLPWRKMGYPVKSQCFHCQFPRGRFSAPAGSEESFRPGWRKIFLVFLRVDVNLAHTLKMCWYLECFQWGWVVQLLQDLWKQVAKKKTAWWVRIPLGLAILTHSPMEFSFCYLETFTKSGLCCAVVIREKTIPSAGRSMMVGGSQSRGWQCPVGHPCPRRQQFQIK